VSAENRAVSPDRPEAAGSLRVSVARAALEAALQAPGVVGSDPGPSRLRVTADPPASPLIGVSATAQADGRYAVDLSLVADMVPLHELAEQVRERVRKRTSGERLAEVLGSINVDFAYVVTREELAAAAAEKEVEEARAAEKLASAGARAKQTSQPTIATSAPERGLGVEVVTAQVGGGPARAGEGGFAEPSVEANAGRDAGALAVRQAALATDQAALAARQAALAAEQAALVAGSNTALPPHACERIPEEQG
jgi:hypothetical protein